MVPNKFSVRMERRGRFNFALYDIVVVKTKQKHLSQYHTKIGLYVPLYNSRFFFINLKLLGFWLSKGAVIKGRLSKLLVFISKN